jgi:Mrp family chromosome partitioning ATPase
MVTLVIKHNENDLDLIRRSLKRLREINPNIIGAVLNGVDLDRASGKDYYYTGYDYGSGTGKAVKRARASAAGKGGDDKRKVAL